MPTQDGVPEGRASGPGASPATDLEDLLVECLRCLEDGGEAALEPVLARHAGRADEVREHLARLGVLGAPGAELPQLGPYRPLRLLGRGGMGEVVLAEQTEPVRRKVAVKRIRREAWTPAIKARFEFERQALALLEHDGIAKIFDAGTTPAGDPYFVMEYVDGEPISLYCDRHALAVDARLALFLQACDALSHAHQRGVLHRDLKPSNLLVQGDPTAPRLKVIDFGLAKSIGTEAVPAADLTVAGQILGTPEYMSPEQASGSQSAVDTRSDVYALGAILYELLTGVTPHAQVPGAGILELLHEIRDGEIRAPAGRVRGLAAEPGRDHARARGCDGVDRLAAKLRGDLDWIVLKALSKEREQRYASVAELAADLKRLLAHEPVLAGPASAIYRLRKFVRRHRASTLAGAAILAVLLVASPIVAFSFGRASHVQARFDVLKDRALLLHLEDRARNKLWPVVPPMVAELEEWLRLARELAARLPEYEKELPRGEADATARGRGHYVDQLILDAHRLLVAELRQFCAPREGSFTLGIEGIASVDKRLAWARQVEAVTLIEPAKLWQEAIASIADVTASPAYKGTKIVPQLGLIPLRKDKDSGLWEFRHVSPDGAPPRTGRGERYRVDPDTDLIFVLIPGGKVEFDFGVENASWVSSVELEPFFLGKHEVTQSQWMRLTGEAPSHYRNPDQELGLQDPARHPVEQVSWEEATRALSLSGLSLPTEAQWVHAARGGTAKPYWPRAGGPPASLFNGADRSAVRARVPVEGVAAEHDDGFPVTAPVDTLRPNPWGLHHVLGNVWEYCLDPAAGPDQRPVSTRPGDGYRSYEQAKNHVVRGGSCRDSPEKVRIDARRVVPADSRGPTFGLRAARQLDPIRNETK